MFLAVRSRERISFNMETFAKPKHALLLLTTMTRLNTRCTSNYFNYVNFIVTYLLSRRTKYGAGYYVYRAFFHSLCTVTDFSAGALPIGVKLYMAVRPHLGQVFSHFGGIAPGMAEFWASTGPYGGVCFLLKHLCGIES